MKSSGLWWKLTASIALCTCVACSKRTDEQKAAPAPKQEQAQEQAAPPPVQPAATPPAATQIPGPGAVEVKASGTLTLNPNPVPVCDKTGSGIATVQWSAEGAKNVEVHLGAPEGPVFAASDKPTGSAKTGPWVSKDTTLFLQDVDNNYPRDAKYTLAKVTAQVVGGGPCP